MSFYQSKNLKDGVLAEFVVMDALEHNSLVLNKGLGITTCVDLSNKPSYPTSNAHHDLDLNIVDCETWDIKDTKSIEVKYAWNNKYPTFFAEILQCGSNTYSEYLVHQPDYMFYVNGCTKRLYCYDGKKFVAAVKANYDNRRLNSYKTAEGVLFDMKSNEFGYIFSYPVGQNYAFVERNYQQEIQHRLLGSKGVQVQGSKTCSGLPTLV